MDDHVYAVTEIVGSSDGSLEKAIENAVTTASHTLRNLEWFEVSEIRGHLKDGHVAHYQVSLKLGLRYDKAK
jgi:flavin-binding protein dodecin